MTTRMLLLADTHVPKRVRRLPDAVLHAIDRADIVAHAGDWVDLQTLDLIESRSRVFHGVYGNNDGPDLRARLPEVARFQVEGLRVAMIHETGPAARREQRMDEAFADTDLLIFGHSHIPWDSVAPSGMRLLNPGSPTDRRRQPVCTMMTVTIDGVGIDATLMPVT
ncbi:phosphodiesterase [Microbacterium sp. SZ1]|uniref:metallophosphoesterase family protein n=1 Tax=Microbacterium sp. SZ1 TaxID=1849736 RepID=UPI000BBC99E9|nr:YfcE family phosphodiesterase [Microbacterium sp. SZ1]PCE14454.1 phosphodiesterase [Microbacterium sp. SZ1]